jgi:hypothetical protein
MAGDKRKVSEDELHMLLEQHRLWLKDKTQGRPLWLQNCDLSKVNLSGAIVDYALFGTTDMTGANLQGVDLSYASFNGANLTEANLVRAKLGDFSNACLKKANLRGADLISSRLNGSSLKGADLGRVKFGGASLFYADLEDVDLSEADFRWLSVGNQKEVMTLQTEPYLIAYTSDVLAIGNEQHALSDWWAFDDQRIAAMDEDGDNGMLAWWQANRPILQAYIQANPAVPHKGSARYRQQNAEAGS